MLSRLFRRNGKAARSPQTKVRRPFKLTLEALEDRCLLDIGGLPYLHSFPSAPVAIYLDFNGGRYGGTTYSAYNGVTTSFSAAEQAQITEAWRQVSAYFAMFNVDVTTQRPTVPFAWDLISNSVSGGVSAVGAFPNSSPRSFNPSGDARTRESGIAHELGHNFGLQHQSDYDRLGVKTNEYSSGYDSLHGPIMGVDFAQSVHKWFIGHPANSATTLQNDMAVITAAIHRFEPASGDGFRPDDYGGDIATATPLTVSGATQSIAGILERLNDADAFSFTTTGGTVVLDAVPDRPSGVALKLAVYDSDGTLLGLKDAATNDQHLSIPLPAGTYYVIVSSQGNYGDVGAYQLAVRTLPSGWDTQDIGSVGRAGYAGYDAATETYSIGGGGTDIWGTADQFRFASTTLTGDGSIVARVTANTATDPWAKAGVMIRNGLGANAANVFMTFGAGNGTASFQYRTTAGGSSTSVTGPNGITAPYWVRIDRTGNTFTGYRSPDGVTWTLQGSATVAMGSTVNIGLAVTSHNNSAINDAAFDNVTLTGVIGTAPVYNSLPAPTGLTLTLGSGTGISLSWNAVAGSIGYAVDRSTDDVNWTQIATPGAGVTTYSDNGLTGSHRYFYRVSARDATGRSVPSDVAAADNRPSAPFNLTVSSNGNNNQFILNWRDVTGESGYRIERSTDGVTFTPVGSVGVNVPSFLDSSSNRFTTYYYRVIATSALGDSPASNVATNNIGLGFPAITPNQLTLQWNAVSGAASYRVERSTNGGTTFTALATVTGGTSYTDTTVLPQTQYYYRVAGQNSSSRGVSPWQYTFTTTPAANQPGDAGFELPNVGSGTFRYNPSGSPWTFAGTSGVSGNGSDFTSGNPNAPQGNQVAFLQGFGSASQTVTFAAGTYTVSLLAAQRSGNASSQTIQVLLDGNAVGTFTPVVATTTYANFSTAAFTVTAGAHTIAIVGLDPDGQDNTVFIDQIQVNSVTLVNGGGFETPSVGSGTFQYNPSGSPWTFAGTSGVSGNGSDFTSGNPNAPEGGQVAFLQGFGGVSQALTFAAGSYTLFFSAAQRGDGNASSQTLQVLVDGMVVGTFTPADANYAGYTTSRFTVTAGAHTIAFVGLDPDGLDNTAFLDQVGLLS
jgi:hypothetical protein